MQGTVISLDIGTTHLKAALFDGSGALLRLEKEPTPSVPGEGGAVYDPAAFRAIVLGQLERLIEASPSVPAGICVTGMAEAGLILDKKTGEPKSELLPWFHPGPLPLADELSAEESDRLFRSTGLRSSFKYGIYKYRWLLSRLGLAPEGTIWLSVCDYIVFCLTGEYVTDPSFAARTYVYDVLSGRWDAERLTAYGLTCENFPRVLPSGAPAGTFRGIPVAVGGHDHVCAAFGLLFSDPRGVCDSAGTSETYVGLLPRENLREGFPPESGLLYGPFVDGGFFFMGNVPSSGHSVEWFRKRLQLSPVEYRELDERTARLSSGPTGILYLPYLTGMGAPWYRPELKAALLGVSEAHDGTQVLKAIFEGIQYQARWLLEILEKAHGVSPGRIICAGGSVKNRLMMQIKADVLNREVSIPAQSEATLSGCAALFLERSLDRDAAAAFLAGAAADSESYAPIPDAASEYAEEYVRRYLPAVRAVSGLWEEHPEQKN